MKKWADRVFCILFVALLLLPLITINTTRNQVSEIDNATLPEMNWRAIDGFRSNFESYLNARIGFRVEALDLYQTLNARCFQLMEHPLYMYGKNGHVFFRESSYLEDYQHLNLDQEAANNFAKNLSEMKQIANAYDAEFIYTLIPDKKTIYSEHMPDNLNILGNVSRTDQLLNALSKTDVDWIYYADVLTEAKTQIPVFNKMYDSGHWNEHGAFVSYQHLYDRIQKYFPEVEFLKQDNFIVKDVTVDSLLVSRFKINEITPEYQPINVTAKDISSELDDLLFFPSPASYHRQYTNPHLDNKSKLLVLHDSYMMNHEKFFFENFMEVTFIHRSNIVNLDVFRKYMEILSPNIVIYETPERVLFPSFESEYIIPDPFL